MVYASFMNIAKPLSLTSNQFEIAVKQALQRAIPKNSALHFEVHGKRDVRGIDGEYEIDASAEFEIFGARIKVLVECKRYNKPVARDLVMTLLAKLHSTAMQKAIMVSTSGFQSGAITFARKHGIALIHVKDGSSSSLTKSEWGMQQPQKTSPTFEAWALFPPDGESLLDRANPGVLEKALTPDPLADDSRSS